MAKIPKVLYGWDLLDLWEPAGVNNVALAEYVINYELSAYDPDTMEPVDIEEAKEHLKDLPELEQHYGKDFQQQFFPALRDEIYEYVFKEHEVVKFAEENGLPLPGEKATGAEIGGDKITDEKPAQEDIAKPSNKPTEEPTSKENVFRQEGPSWTITYEGETLRGLRGKGFELIHHLILHKEKLFHTDELSQEIDKIVPTEGNEQGKTYLDHYDESTQTITQGIDAKAKIYGKSMEELKKYRTHLNEELRKAETDPPRKANVEKELEEFNRYCTQYFGSGGQSRKDRDNPMRTKDRMCKRIERALDNIKKNNENIWRHFYSALRPINDFFQSYRPDRDISWLTE